MIQVLIVDDEPKMGKVLSAMLAGEAYAVETATRGLAALERLRQKPFDVVLCDLRMPDVDGLTVLKQAKALRPELDFVMMTAFATVGTAVQAMKDGAYDYLIKPFDMEELRLLLRKIVERRTLIAANQELQRRLDSASGAGFGGLVGRSAKMREVYQLIGQVAPRDTTVLVRGESGTGKELVARAIHSHSARANGPLVDVHCGAIPETLLES
ncbi:MAG: sigma-54-dependent Fis family transcriptional regulator, partial [Planctomycetes bacterium]|nr:sigma-54-dependent Fis family transcriptional regulator [Planctomycetota bacterium]